jgi:hypothetical protein
LTPTATAVTDLNFDLLGEDESVSASFTYTHAYCEPLLIDFYDMSDEDNEKELTFITSSVSENTLIITATPPIDYSHVGSYTVKAVISGSVD